MAEHDIVADLKLWMHLYDSGLSHQPPTGSGRWLIERARDEIVALRDALVTARMHVEALKEKL